MAANPETLFPATDFEDEEYKEPTPEERGDVVDAEQDNEPEAETEVETEAEAEAEGEGEEDVTAEAEEEEEASTEEEEIRIPKARFDEVNQERKQYREELERLKRELEELKRGREVETQPEDEAEADDLDVPAYDFEAKEREYAQALLDGDTAKASALRREINEKLVEIASAVSSREARQVQELVQQQLAYKEAVEELNAQYPELVPDHPDYNQQVIDDIFELYEGYLLKGIDPASAIRKATNIIAKANGLGQRAEDEAPSTKTAKKPPKVEKKLEARKKQPPKQSGTSPRDAEDGEYDILNMTEEEFDALPESVKRRLRGDF